MNKKKILIVTRNLPPLIGGMERLNWHIADEFSKENKVILLSHNDAKSYAPEFCIFYGIKLNPIYIFLIFAFFKTCYLCLKHKPDVIFAGSGLTAPIVVFWAKLFNKKSIVYIHGLDIATNHPIYNLIWIPFIRNANQVIANSTPTQNICAQKGIVENKIKIIHPGVTFPPLAQNEEILEKLKKSYALENTKILISVGRLTKRKALKEFVDLSLPKIIKDSPNTRLIIIGDTPSQSLNKNLQSKEDILLAARKHDIEDRIIFTGNIADDKVLSSWFYIADLHVFPVKHIADDPEGFGMVAIEAAAHGTPTISFKTGGIVDAVSVPKTGYLIEPENYDELANKVISILNETDHIKAADCQKFAEKFSWKNFALKLKKQIQEN